MPGPLRHLSLDSLSDSSKQNDSQVASINSSAFQLKQDKTFPLSLFCNRSSGKYGNSSQAQLSRRKNRVIIDGENHTWRKAVTKVSSELTMPSRKTLFQNANLEADTEQIVPRRMKRSMTASEIPCASRSYAFSTPLTQLLNPLQRTVRDPPARMLLTVSVLGSIQASRLIVTLDATVKDVTREALKACAKEGRLPSGGVDMDDYELHYSEFVLESLNPDDAVRNLGARNFVLCPKRHHNQSSSSSSSSSSSPSPCSVNDNYLSSSTWSCSPASLPKSTSTSASFSLRASSLNSSSSSASSPCCASSACLPAVSLLSQARNVLKPWLNVLGLVSA